MVALTQSQCSVWREDKKVLTHSCEEIQEAVGYAPDEEAEIYKKKQEV